MKQFLFALALTALFAPSLVVHAQVPCGNIVTYVDSYDPSLGLIHTPVTNCANPFDETSSDHNKYPLVIDGTTLLNGDSIEVSLGGTSNFRFLGTDQGYTTVYNQLFIHDGNDYRFVITEPSVPFEDDYRRLGTELSLSTEDLELYLSVISRETDYFGLSEDEKSGYSTFIEYVDVHFIPVVPKLGAGTYTLVSKQGLLILNRGNVLQRLFAVLVPTANAQSSSEEVYTLTFTITEPTPEPTGASSVLFLPGIQSSALSKNGLLGTDDQIWLPDAGNQDVRQLAMNTDGGSVHDVHTTGIIGTIPGGGSVYDSFARFMVRLVDDEIIDGWTPFAYDWRYSAMDIVENGTKYAEGTRFAVAEVERLASSSYSKKVTLIGHSNGGLFAKALMRKLEEEGKSDLIDTVVFLATPQLGTPKTIGTILHGYDQEKLRGWLIDDAAARDVIQNMPGAYGLLPSQKYFDTVTHPVVTFETSPATQLFRNTYGTSIDSEAEMSQFMIGSTDGRPNAITIDDALKANGGLLADALEDHLVQLDSWVAPSGVAVVEIVGVGLDTVKSFEYRSFTERFCTLLVFCHTEAVYKPVPQFSQYGDKTVIGPSAEAYGGEKKKYFVDLINVRRDIGLFEHYNIAEAYPVQNLVQDILQSTTSAPNQFISTSSLAYADERILLGVHSPVTIEVTDQNGKQVKLNGEVAIEDIPNSSYLEVGDSKYVLVPASGRYNINILGTGNGSLTFSMDRLNGETQTKINSIRVATITPATSIQVAYIAESLGNVTIDTNGDGQADQILTSAGVDITPKITYLTLKTAIDALALSKVRKLPLQILVAAADTFDKKSLINPKLVPLELATLRELESLLFIYQKKGWITQSEYNTIIKITNKLK